MLLVRGLIWDEWNRKHISKHHITPEEVEEVCQEKHSISKSYRGRILITGKTKKDRNIAIVLTPEDRNLNRYNKGIYYVITAFEKEVDI